MNGTLTTEMIERFGSTSRKKISIRHMAPLKAQAALEMVWDASHATLDLSSDIPCWPRVSRYYIYGTGYKELSSISRSSLYVAGLHL